MENIIEEGEIKGAIDPITKQQTRTILEQMEKSVCRITSDNLNGTGFFCKIELNNRKIPVLITNYHIINDKFLDSKQEIRLYFSNECKVIKLNKDRKVYSSSNKEYDIMILKVNDNDDIQNINYLELDSNLFKRNSELEYEDSSIYILHYPMGKEIKVSYGYGIKEKDKNNIIHKCKTTGGSSGSPIFNLSTNKVIGVHKSFCKNTNKDNKEDCYNLGTLLKYPLIDLKFKNRHVIRRYKNPFNNFPTQMPENKIEKISEREKLLDRNFDLNNHLINKHLKKDTNKYDLEHDLNRTPKNTLELAKKYDKEKNKRICINNSNNNLKNIEQKEIFDNKNIDKMNNKPDIIFKKQIIENKVKAINERENPLVNNNNNLNNNNLNYIILNKDNNKDISKYDPGKFKNIIISKDNLLSNNKVESTPLNNKEKNGRINLNLNINNNLKNNEQKQINDNKKFDRKINKQDVRAKTPKIKNKIEEIYKKQNIEHSNKNPINKKMIKFNDNNNHNHKHVKANISYDILENNFNNYKDDKYNSYKHKFGLIQRYNNNEKQLINNYSYKEINVEPFEESLSKNINIINERYKNNQKFPDFKFQANKNICMKDSNRMNLNNCKEKKRKDNNQDKTNEIPLNVKNTLRNDLKAKQIFKNINHAKNIGDNFNHFQYPKDSKFDTPNKIQNDKKKIEQKLSAPNIINCIKNKKF